nr:glucokinase [Kofleriaceae bacterium]
MILAGDVGGTKTVLALFDPTSTPLRAIKEQVFPCADFDSLESIIDAFLGPRQADALWGACFGVAGPVHDNASKITNLPWTIDGRALSHKLGGIRVDILNDLQAWAMGSLVLPLDAFTVIQEGARVENGPIAVVAPGTGLGEAILISDGKRYRALASEGGHADFAPTTDEEIDLLRFLRKRHGNHVSYERVLSGDGIGDLYDFARISSGTSEPSWLAAEIAKSDRNAVVSKAALAKSDPACVHALEMFVSILGAEAGNLALRVMATGGVVIGGGIPAKILPALQTGNLVARFNDKGRFGAWTRGIGVRVALDPRAALLGAAVAAASGKETKEA